jgi:hypothetical protein
MIVSGLTGVAIEPGPAVVMFMSRSPRQKRVPEQVSRQIPKVEPVGGDLVRLYFEVERAGACDDQSTFLVRSSCLSGSLDFAMTSVREISERKPRRRWPPLIERTPVRRFAPAGSHRNCEY